MGQDIGANGGISGIVSFPGAGVLFVARIYHVKETLTSTAIDRTGPDEAFEVMRQADQGGTLILSGIMRFDGYPEPGSLKGATGTVTVRHLYRNGGTPASITYPVAVTESERERDEKDMSAIDFTIACTITGQPTYTGFGGSQPPAAGFPDYSTKEIRVGRDKTLDPQLINDFVNQTFDVVGVDATDTAEWNAMTDFIATAVIPVGGLKLRSAKWVRTDSWGARLSVVWSRTNSADDLINPRTTTHIDQDNLENSATTAASNATPPNPLVTNTVLVSSGSLKINDAVTLNTSEYGKWTLRQSIEMGESFLSVDPDGIAAQGPLSSVVGMSGLAPTIVFSGGGGGTGAAAAVITNRLGSVVQILVTDQGSGYTTAPSYALVGGSGSGFAPAAVTISGDKVVNVSFANGGIGYNGTAAAPPWLPTITINDDVGSGAVIYAVADASGAIVRLVVASGGKNYSAASALAYGGFGSGFIPGEVTLNDGVITAVDVASPGTGYTDITRPDLQIINCQVDSISAFNSKVVYQLGLRTPLDEITWGGTATDADPNAIASSAEITAVALTTSPPAVPAAPLTELVHAGRRTQQTTLSKTIFRDQYRMLDSIGQITVPHTNGTSDPVELEKEEISEILPLGMLSFDQLLQATRASYSGDNTFGGVRGQLLPNNKAELIRIVDRSDGVIHTRLLQQLEQVNAIGTQVMVSYVKTRASGLKTVYIAKRPVWRARGQIRIHRRIISADYNVIHSGAYSVTHSELVGMVNNAPFLGYPGGTGLLGDGILGSVMYAGYDLQFQQSLDGGNHLFVGDYVLEIDSLFFQDDSMVLAGDYIETTAGIGGPGEVNCSTFGWSIGYPAYADLSVLLP